MGVGLPKEMEAQGLRYGTLFPIPSQRQTDGRTGEAGHREDRERWVGEKLKGKRKQTEQLKSSSWAPPLPFFSLPSQHTHTHKFKTYRGQRTRQKRGKREGRGLRSQKEL